MESYILLGFGPALGDAIMVSDAIVFLGQQEFFLGELFNLKSYLHMSGEINTQEHVNHRG
jgi:hypothetical protein